MNERKFWIRPEREKYLVAGFMVTCAIGIIVTTHWKNLDRTEVRQNIKMKAGKSTEKQRRKLKEIQYTPARLRVGNTQ